MTNSFANHSLFQAEDRFAARIQWVSFSNQSGMTIPPFSVVVATQWYFPDPADPDSSNFLTPYFTGKQAKDPVNPFAVYLTGAASTPAASDKLPNGVAARPTLDLPLLASISSDGGGSDLAFRACGASDGSWTATRDMPGLAMLAVPQSKLVLVVATIGPYRGGLSSQKISPGPGAVTVTPLIEPFNSIGIATLPTSTTATITCYNPYANIDGTAANANLRCTYDWVGGNWELIAADPCPPGS